MTLRPKTTELEPGEREILQRLWAHYKQHRSWPILAERLRVEFDEKDQDFDEVSKQWQHIRIDTGHDRESRGRLSTGLDDLLYLPEVRELFALLPRLFKLAAQRFKERPTSTSNLDEPRITLSDLVSIWGDAERAGLVADLLEKNHLDMLSCSGHDETGPHFSPRIQILRYEDLTRLEEIEHLPEREPVPELTSAPRGIHLQVLRALHQYCVRELRWPAPSRFVTEQLDRLGYTVTVLEQLHPDFLKDTPHFFGNRELELTVSCIKWVASTEEQQLLLELLREMFERYKSDTEARTYRASLSELAGRIASTPERLAPLLKYLTTEPWGHVQIEGASPGEWLLFWNEKIFRFRKLDDWDGYLKERDELKPGRLRKRVPAPPPPRPPAYSEIVGGMAIGGVRTQAPAASGLSGRLFISFAGEDDVLAQALSELIHRGCGVPEQSITCTAWNDIEGGESVSEELKKALKSSALFLPLITEHYFDSKYAMIELGGAWLAEKPLLPVLVPPMDEGDLQAILIGKKAYFLDNPRSLDRLSDRLRQVLRTEVSIDKWHRERDRFLRDVEQELAHRQATKKHSEWPPG